MDQQIKQVLESAHIEKRDYSVDPWRIVTSDGREIYVPETFDHPVSGQITISAPLSFPRKRDAVEYLRQAGQ